MLTDPAETGAVTLALCQDIQAHAYDYPCTSSRSGRGASSDACPRPERIAQALRK